MSNPIVAYKGTKTAVSALPASGQLMGDAWVVTTTYNVYVWDGMLWKNKGPMVNHVKISFSGSLPQNASVVAVS